MSNSLSEKSKVLCNALNHYLISVSLDSKYGRDRLGKIEKEFSPYHDYLHNNEPTDAWVISEHKIFLPVLPPYHKNLNETIKDADHIHDTDSLNSLRNELNIVKHYEKLLKPLTRPN